MNFWRPAALAPDPAVDAGFMDAALALGRGQLGQTWPNPAVGAVVVKDGRIVGEGVTAKGGRPHGEPLAIAMAGNATVGATLYVTLEPCSHRSVRGGTPCLEHILLSGIRRVVIGMADPNPHISGVGVALLRSAGVAVTLGVRGAEAEEDHLGHCLRTAEGRPMVTLKLARTADGYCAPLGGGRLQVSGEAAMHEVHRIRARHEAIMVGVGTVLSDNPMLNVRLPGLEDRSPIRVVLDSDLRTPPTSALVQSVARYPLLIVAADDADATRAEALQIAGAEILRAPRLASGRLDLAACMRLLAQRGFTRVFSEGGPTVAEALVAHGLADRVIVSTADHALGEPGIVAIRPPVAEALADPQRFVSKGAERFGSDVFETFRKVV